MTTEEKIIKNKVGLLNLAEMLGNVSQACKVMGCKRRSKNVPLKRLDGPVVGGLKVYRLMPCWLV